MRLSEGRQRWGALYAALGPHARTVAIGALAGAMAGVVAGGIGGRIAMRVSAMATEDRFQGTLTEAGNRVGDITVGGTLGLVLFGGALIGILGGLIYLGVRRWLMDLGPWKGLGFGLLLLAMLGWVVISGDNFDFHRFGPPPLNIGMFALIFVAFGLIVVALHDWLERVLPRPSRSMVGLVSLGIHAFGLSLALVFALTFVRFGGFGSGGAAILSSLVLWYAVLIMPVAGLLLARAAGRFQGLSDLLGRRRWLVLAVAVLALPVVLGVVLELQAVLDILEADRRG